MVRRRCTASWWREPILDCQLVIFHAHPVARLRALQFEERGFDSHDGLLRACAGAPPGEHGDRGVQSVTKIEQAALLDVGRFYFVRQIKLFSSLQHRPRLHLELLEHPYQSRLGKQLDKTHCLGLYAPQRALCRGA